jgi:hypothetical protein
MRKDDLMLMLCLYSCLFGKGDDAMLKYVHNKSRICQKLRSLWRSKEKFYTPWKKFYTVKKGKKIEDKFDFSKYD